MSVPNPKQLTANIRESFLDEAPTMSPDFIRAVWLGNFLGLAEAAEELRGRLPDEHFVSQLIEMRKEYMRAL